MLNPHRRFLLAILPFAAVSFLATEVNAVDFGRQIRPIFSDKCFACHGPDEATRESGLRLDKIESAMHAAESSAIAIVPGDIEASEIVRRIRALDDTRMPPVDSHKTLTETERELIVQWISEGAPVEQHWSFQLPTRPSLPPVMNEAWAHQPIDRFVLAALESQGWQPSPEANPETLIRRLTFDLTGLPPTLDEVDSFLADKSPNAYERVVDRLLASEHFGERMAVDWLDAARFADTNGYHLDNGRDMSAWRAWVIEAFNQNMPFDQFTIEQLAGDLLPDATQSQQIASGFNRNHMINFEGGAIADEYLTAYIVDRVNTTGAVWLSITVGCAQCHDHKYDPLTQKEFYQLYAFFNRVPEKGLDGNQGNAQPLVSLPTETQQEELKKLDAELAALEEQQTPSAETPSAETPSAETQSPETQSPETKAQLEKLREQRKQLVASISTSMVMREDARPRETFVLMRGQYDQKGEKVEAATPEFLPPLPKGASNNRLGLAQWLVDGNNPLVARVTVNRFWQSLFGVGIVKTSEDFGSQCDTPSHPELLDWLAAEFTDSSDPDVGRWNVKGILKRIVMSNTYRQTSQVDRQLYERDPENRFLARGARFRLQAEFVRDQALAASGLLQHRIGGARVSPYQPDGLWQELSSRNDSSKWTAQVFQQSTGADLYRRTMYTFWKRTSPPPSLVTFDAPDREICILRRSRTNTPLQALILMNDPTYVEASRCLAERLLSSNSSDQQRLINLWRGLTSRLPSADEQVVLTRMLSKQREHFANTPSAAEALLKVGDSPAQGGLDASEVAAWSIVCSAVLNLDEVVTRN